VSIRTLRPILFFTLALGACQSRENEELDRSIAALDKFGEQLAELEQRHAEQERQRLEAERARPAGPPQAAMISSGGLTLPVRDAIVYEDGLGRRLVLSTGKASCAMPEVVHGDLEVVFMFQPDSVSPYRLTLRGVAFKDGVGTPLAGSTLVVPGAEGADTAEFTLSGVADVGPRKLAIDGIVVADLCPSVTPAPRSPPRPRP
jgi:hypothetical protein